MCFRAFFLFLNNAVDRNCLCLHTTHSVTFCARGLMQWNKKKRKKKKHNQMSLQNPTLPMPVPWAPGGAKWRGKQHIWMSAAHHHTSVIGLKTSSEEVLTEGRWLISINWSIRPPHLFHAPATWLHSQQPRTGRLKLRPLAFRQQNGNKRKKKKKKPPSV